MTNANDPPVKDANDARLAPPGAGVPAIERFIGGRMLALRRWRFTRTRLDAEFESERSAIAGLYRGLPEGQLKVRILIPRLRGLEDSSRNWSVLMTLDHLRIVNDGIGRIIELLARGDRPEGSVSVAAVKPRPDVGSEAAAEHETACDRYAEVLAKCGNLRGTPRHAHPWFGPLDAKGWHAMASMHMGIHRRQIACILDAKPGSAP